jgi:hypothetical protein
MKKIIWVVNKCFFLYDSKLLAILTDLLLIFILDPSNKAVYTQPKHFDHCKAEQAFLMIIFEFIGLYGYHLIVKLCNQTFLFWQFDPCWWLNVSKATSLILSWQDSVIFILLVVFKGFLFFMDIMRSNHKN